jgi:trimeric autotransporter adhesin
MSTKTTFKRVALVAVAALGFGMLSAIPSSAVITSFYVHKQSASGSVVKCAQTLTSNASTTITSGGGACLSDALTPAGTGIWTNEDGFVGTIVTNTTPAGGTAATIAAASPAQAAAASAWYKGTIATTTVASGIVANAINGMTVTAGAAAAFNLRGNAVATADAAAKASIGGQIISGAVETAATTDQGLILPFTAPITAGVYTVVIQVKDAADYAATDPTMSFTLTVTAASDLSLGLSTARMTGPGLDGATITTNAVPRAASKTAGTPIANVEVLLKKANATDDTQLHTITATVSGVGYVAISGTATHAAGAATTRVATDATADAARYVLIGSDGNAGTGTVTVSVTNVNTLATSVLGTFTYTSYGAATALAVTANYTIGRAGGYTTGWATDGTRAAESTSPLSAAANTSAPAFTIKVTDSAGALVNLTNALGAAIVPTVVSSDISVISSGLCVLDAGTAVYGTGKGVGYYNCSFTTAPTSVSGGKATLTIRTPNPADTSLFLTTTLDVTTGGSAATGTTTLALDKASYEAGEGMTVTLTAKDSAGNPVADGIASPAVTFNKATGGAAVAASWFTAGKVTSDDALGRKTIYAPTASGAFKAEATAASLATLNATATVGDDAATTAAAAAGDAAAEATDAANAATDAANAAAEAADAATAAAQDAADAVAALSASVATMVSDLKKQITSLTNLVIKIQKKVRA